MSVRSPRSNFMAASAHCPIDLPVGVEYDAELKVVVARLINPANMLDTQPWLRCVVPYEMEVKMELHMLIHVSY